MSDKWVQKFKKEALPIIIKEINPQSMILFGSRANGHARDDSDLDILIISDFFKKIPFIKRMPFMMKKVRFQKHIDFICYSLEEFEHIKSTSFVVQNALIQGKKIGGFL